MNIKKFYNEEYFDFYLAYEYVPDSEIASSIVATSLTTGQSGSEEDLLSPKVFYIRISIFQSRYFFDYNS